MVICFENSGIVLKACFIVHHIILRSLHFSAATEVGKGNHLALALISPNYSISYTWRASFIVECLEAIACYFLESLNVASWIIKVEFFEAYANVAVGLQSPEKLIFESEFLCLITIP